MPITWKNVNQRESDNAARFMAGANQRVDSMFEGLGQEVERQQGIADGNYLNQRDNQTQDFLNKVNQIGSVKELQAARDNGTLDRMRQELGPNVDDAAIREGIDQRFKSLNRITNSSLGQQTERLAQDLTQEEIESADLTQQQTRVKTEGARRDNEEQRRATERARTTGERRDEQYNRSEDARNATLAGNDLINNMTAEVRNRRDQQSQALTEIGQQYGVDELTPESLAQLPEQQRQGIMFDMQRQGVSLKAPSANEVLDTFENRLNSNEHTYSPDQRKQLRSQLLSEFSGLSDLKEGPIKQQAREDKKKIEKEYEANTKELEYNYKKQQDNNTFYNKSKGDMFYEAQDLWDDIESEEFGTSWTFPKENITGAKNAVLELMDSGITMPDGSKIDSIPPSMIKLAIQNSGDNEELDWQHWTRSSQMKQKLQEVIQSSGGVAAFREAQEMRANYLRDKKKLDEQRLQRETGVVRDAESRAGVNRSNMDALEALRTGGNETPRLSLSDLMQ